MYTQEERKNFFSKFKQGLLKFKQTGWMGRWDKISNIWLEGEREN